MPCKIIDITGEKYGRLTVIKTFRNKNVTYCKCECECGKIIKTQKGHLRNGGVKSCGCLLKELDKNIINKSFGRLIVMSIIRKNKSTICKCMCACGKPKSVSSSNLLNGNTKSCGCLDSETRKSFVSLVGKKFNRLTILSNSMKNCKKMCICKCDCGKIKTINASSLVSGRTKSCGCYNREINTLGLGVAAFNHLYSMYIRSAKKRNLSFELTKDQVKNIFLSNCNYCGKTPNQKYQNTNGNGPFIYNGIDRIDNAIGYIIDNCVPCCSRCNHAKHTMNVIDYYSLIKRSYEHLEKTGKIIRTEPIHV